MIGTHYDICMDKVNKTLSEPYGKISGNKFVPYSWSELCEHFNELESRIVYQSGEALRCCFKKERKCMGTLPKACDKLENKRQEIFMASEKVRMQNALVKKKLKTLTRREIFEETMIDVAKNFTRSDFKTPTSKIGDSKISIILNVCDWHYGMKVSNFLNEFNKDVFDKRIQQIIDEVMALANKFDAEKIYINNLNDLISGYIHTSIRVMNDDDTITQLMYVIDTLCHMANIFSTVAEVEYREVIDNHSRMSAKKEDSISAENLSRLISFTMEKALGNNERVSIIGNDYGSDIMSLEIYGWKYAGVHGHLDNVSNVVQNISLMTRSFYSAIFMAHKHHFMADEIHGTYVLSSGCLVGTDEYSKDIRYSSNPSQNVIIVTEDDPLYMIRTIKFKD